ncbi:MAG: hypothetical protein FJ291_24115 [Planctomycetes bacterium]|nr:hypothetical protein [Planctomycetota bacterium]
MPTNRRLARAVAEGRIMAERQELRKYAEGLPEIYREILAAFPRFTPGRKAGYGLAYQTLDDDFERRGVRYTMGEIMLACEKLAERGLVEIKHGFFVCPTDRGEQLIAAVTGQEPAIAETVPDLPALP